MKWKPVPIEPTAEMRNAVLECGDTIDDIYAAMLDSAPNYLANTRWNEIKFEPFTITLHDFGEIVEQAHVHPELTMITTSVNGDKEPDRVIDTKYFMMIADAVKERISK